MNWCSYTQNLTKISLKKQLKSKQKPKEVKLLFGHQLGKERVLLAIVCLVCNVPLFLISRTIKLISEGSIYSCMHSQSMLHLQQYNQVYFLDQIASVELVLKRRKKSKAHFLIGVQRRKFEEAIIIRIFLKQVRNFNRILSKLKRNITILISLYQESSHQAHVSDYFRFSNKKERINTSSPLSIANSQMMMKMGLESLILDQDLQHNFRPQHLFSKSLFQVEQS